MSKATISIHGERICKCSNCLWLGHLPYKYEYVGSESDISVVAIDNCGHMIGIWRFDDYGNKHIYSCGTWVDPKFRKHGLAKKLWDFGLKYYKPKSIEIDVVSNTGYSLVCSMKERFPKIRWCVDTRSFYGRKPRRLRVKQ